MSSVNRDNFTSFPVFLFHLMALARISYRSLNEEIDERIIHTLFVILEEKAFHLSSLNLIFSLGLIHLIGGQLIQAFGLSKYSFVFPKNLLDRDYGIYIFWQAKSFKGDI